MTDLGDDETPRAPDEQDEATIMPWIWGAIGLVVIAAFVAFTFFAAPQAPLRHPPAAAPLNKPPGQGY